MSDLKPAGEVCISKRMVIIGQNEERNTDGSGLKSDVLVYTQDQVDALESRIAQLEAVAEAQQEYVDLLEDELTKATPLLTAHGWRSYRVGAGISARKKIEDAKRAADYRSEKE